MEWLPEVCSQLHGEMDSIYWMMILPLIVFLIVLEMFKTKGAEFPERVPANFLNGDHLISSKGTTQFPVMGTIF